MVGATEEVGALNREAQSHYVTPNISGSQQHPSPLERGALVDKLSRRVRRLEGTAIQTLVTPPSTKYNATPLTEQVDYIASCSRFSSANWETEICTYKTVMMWYIKQYKHTRT